MQPPTSTNRSRGPLVALALLGLISVVLVGCGRGVADPVASERLDQVRARGSLSSVPARRVAAPTAEPAPTVPDPRCRAARRLFLRAAITASPSPFDYSDYAERRLAEVMPLAEGDARADLEEVGKLMDLYQSRSSGPTLTQTLAAKPLMDRLLIWTVSVCPPPQRPVWGCSVQMAYGTADAFSGQYFASVGQLAPDAVVVDILGEVTGRRIELARNQNRVVYAWIDAFGLVRRRVEVRRLLDLWFLDDAQRCDDPVPLDHPLDLREPIVEELPDVEDGPEYATTTTTTTLPVDTTTTSTAEVPCGYLPDDPDAEYTSLGDYMKNGPAEPSCWKLLSPEGIACVSDPPAGKFFDCFDL